MKFLLRLLTWWNSQTLGTQIFTARKGIKVGEDEQGNVYYRTRDDKRRWVIYNGECEASRISPIGMVGFTSLGISRPARRRWRARHGNCRIRKTAPALPMPMFRAVRCVAQRRWSAAITRRGSPSKARARSESR